MMKQHLLLSTLIGIITLPAWAATNAGVQVNPANVMNTVTQTLPTSAPTRGHLQIDQNQQVIENADEVHSSFVLKKVQILGAEHPVPANVQQVYQNLIGKKMDFHSIQKLADDMELQYRQDGYILVQVILPPQEIDLKQGVLQLRVVEGQIQSVIFKGDAPRGAKSQLERYASQIEDEDPITYKTLDHFITLANQLPGIDVSATLVPNKNIVGAADLVVDVTEKPVGGFVNFNNRGTSYIGPGQGSAGFSLYNLFGADALSVVGATSMSNPNQLAYMNLGYDIAIGKYGTEINPSITTTQTRPGNVLSAFDMYGESTKYAFNVNQPLLVSTAQNLTLQGGFYHLDSFNSVFNSEQLYQDNISAFTLGLNYAGVFLKSYNQVSLSSSVGVPIFGAPATPPNPSIANGKTEFMLFNLNTSTIHYFTNKISMVLGSQFQITPDSLLSSEQIGYGGQSFGQAYIPYVISGDNGAMGSIALRYDLPSYGIVQVLQPQVFYDIGSVWLNDPTNGAAGGASAQSAGVGLTTQLANHIQMGVTFAKPIRITQTTGINMGWQGFFNLTGVF